MNISFEIYTISTAFKESDGKLKMPPAQNYLDLKSAIEQMKNIANDYKSEDGEVIEFISETGLFESIVRFHGNDGRSYLWQLSKQKISKSY